MEWTRVTQKEGHVAEMRLLLNALPPGFRPLGVVHVGAHRGQEVESYRERGFQDLLLIEANPDHCRVLNEMFASDPRIEILNCAIADKPGRSQLKIHTSRSGSTEPASLLDLAAFKDIVSTLKTTDAIDVDVSTLDRLWKEGTIDFERHNMLVIDVQGAERMVLDGAPSSLRNFDAIVIEVAMVELYTGAALEAELLALLEGHGFHPALSVDHEMYRGEDTPENRFTAWGECLLLRSS